MDEHTATIIVGTVVAISGVIVPVTTAYLSLRNARESRQETRELAQAAAVAVAHAAVKVEEMQTDLRTSSVKADTKLDSIHALVNSQLTDAISRFKNSLITIDELKLVIDRLTAKHDTQHVAVEVGEPPADHTVEAIMAKLTPAVRAAVAKAMSRTTKP